MSEDFLNLAPFPTRLREVRASSVVCRETLEIQIHQEYLEI